MRGRGETRCERSGEERASEGEVDKERSII